MRSTVIYTVFLTTAACIFSVFAGGTTTTITVTAPAPTSTPLPASQCNTANLECCNSLHYAGDNLVTVLLGLLGVVLDTVEALVGITCAPLTIGSSGTSCSAQPLCCTNNDFNGIIAIGCVPININL